MKTEYGKIIVTAKTFNGLPPGFSEKKYIFPVEKEKEFIVKNYDVYRIKIIDVDGDRVHLGINCFTNWFYEENPSMAKRLNDEDDYQIPRYYSRAFKRMEEVLNANEPGINVGTLEELTDIGYSIKIEYRK